MNNINERMAKVMGWHRGKDKNKEYSDRYYSKEGGNPIIWVSDSGMPRTWHPDTSIEQAMMCVNKAFGAEYSIDISFYKHQVIVFYKGKPIAQAGFVGEDTLPLAICEAILEAKDE